MSWARSTTVNLLVNSTSIGLKMARILEVRVAYIGYLLGPLCAGLAILTTVYAAAWATARTRGNRYSAIST